MIKIFNFSLYIISKILYNLNMKKREKITVTKYKYSYEYLSSVAVIYNDVRLIRGAVYVITARSSL